MRILSYEIKKRVETKYLSFNKAYFGWIKFEILPASVDKIGKEIKNNENILRFIMVKTVRENTMHTFRPPMVSRENNREEIIKAPKKKTEISEAEIDKSIDELLVEN
jgi:ribosomal protein S6